jgi:hypothetical protein
MAWIHSKSLQCSDHLSEAETGRIPGHKVSTHSLDQDFPVSWKPYIDIHAMGTGLMTPTQVAT